MNLNPDFEKEFPESAFIIEQSAAGKKQFEIKAILDENRKDPWWNQDERPLATYSGIVNIAHERYAEWCEVMENTELCGKKIQAWDSVKLVGDLTPDDLLGFSSDGLFFSVRLSNCIENMANYHGGTIGPILRMTQNELLKSRNFGRKTLKEWRSVVAFLKANVLREQKESEIDRLREENAKLISVLQPFANKWTYIQAKINDGDNTWRTNQMSARVAWKDCENAANAIQSIANEKDDKK